MHTTRDKDRLLHRVRRIRGQIEAVEKAIATEQECARVLLTVAACRGALTSLTSELLEDFIRFHVAGRAARGPAGRTRATEELIGMVRAYLK